MASPEQRESQKKAGDYILLRELYETQILPYIPIDRTSSASIMVIGCGRIGGIEALVLRHLYPNARISLIDIDQEAIDEAKNDFKKYATIYNLEQTGNVEFSVLDIYNSPNTDLFDIVITRGPGGKFHDEDVDIGSFVKQSGKFTKPGGYFVTTATTRPYDAHSIQFGLSMLTYRSINYSHLPQRIQPNYGGNIADVFVTQR